MCVLAVLGVCFTFFLTIPTLAGYAISEFGVSKSAAGLASSSMLFGAVFSRIVAGRTISKFGIRKVAVWSLIGLLVMCLAYLLPATFASLVVIRVLHGLFFGFANTALASAAIGLAPISRRGAASGWSMIGHTIGTGVASFAALALVNSGAGQLPVFLLTIGFAAFALIAALIAGRHLPGPPPAGAPRSRKWIGRNALPIGVVVGLCAGANAVVVAYLNLFAAERNLVAAAGVYFLVFALIIAVTRPGLGSLQDRVNDDFLAIPLLVVVPIGITLTAFAGGPAMLLAGAAFIGLGYGTMVTVGQAIAVSRMSPLEMGLAVSSYYLLLDASTGLGPVVLGTLVEPFGYRTTFLAAAALPLIGLAVYLFVARRVPRYPQTYP